MRLDARISWDMLAPPHFMKASLGKVHEPRAPLHAMRCWVCECDADRTRPHHRNRDSRRGGGRKLKEGTIEKEGENEKIEKSRVKYGPTSWLRNR